MNYLGKIAALSIDLIPEFGLILLTIIMPKIFKFTSIVSGELVMPEVDTNINLVDYDQLINMGDNKNVLNYTGKLFAYVDWAFYVFGLLTLLFQVFRLILILSINGHWTYISVIANIILFFLIVFIFIRSDEFFKKNIEEGIEDYKKEAAVYITRQSIKIGERKKPKFCYIRTHITKKFKVFCFFMKKKEETKPIVLRRRFFFLGYGRSKKVKVLKLLWILLQFAFKILYLIFIIDTLGIGWIWIK